MYSIFYVSNHYYVPIIDGIIFELLYFQILLLETSTFLVLVGLVEVGVGVEEVVLLLVDGQPRGHEVGQQRFLGQYFASEV